MKKAQEKKGDMSAYPPYFDVIEKLRDEWDAVAEFSEIEESGISYAAPGMFLTIKDAIKGRGDQTILPDDCGFADNDLCYAES